MGTAEARRAFVRGCALPVLIDFSSDDCITGAIIARGMAWDAYDRNAGIERALSDASPPRDAMLSAETIAFPRIPMFTSSHDTTTKNILFTIQTTSPIINRR